MCKVNVKNLLETSSRQALSMNFLRVVISCQCCVVTTDVTGRKVHGVNFFVSDKYVQAYGAHTYNAPCRPLGELLSYTPERTTFSHLARKGTRAKACGA